MALSERIEILEEENSTQTTARYIFKIQQTPDDWYASAQVRSSRHTKCIAIEEIARRLANIETIWISQTKILKSQPQRRQHNRIENRKSKVRLGTTTTIHTKVKKKHMFR